MEEQTEPVTEDQLKACDHIAVQRKSGFYHHGLVVSITEDIIQIIHWTGENMASADVQTTSLEGFLGTDTTLRRVTTYKGAGGSTIQIKPTEEIAKIAKFVWKNGHKFKGKYNLFSHNCEHLVTFMRTGVQISGQIIVMRGVISKSLHRNKIEKL